MAQSPAADRACARVGVATLEGATTGGPGDSAGDRVPYPHRPAAARISPEKARGSPADPATALIPCLIPDPESWNHASSPYCKPLPAQAIAANPRAQRKNTYL